MNKDVRVSVTKRMIKGGLVNLLKTKPLNKIKVNELCEESGINRTTFYRHYETLGDVLTEIEKDFYKQSNINRWPESPDFIFKEIN